MSKYSKYYFTTALDDMNDDIKKGLEYVGRLRTCNADVWQSKEYGTYYLRSYNTFVACVDNYSESSECCDFLRVVYGYTSTSAQHIRKFFDDYAELKQIVFRYDVDSTGIYYQRTK